MDQAVHFRDQPMARPAALQLSAPISFPSVAPDPPQPANRLLDLAGRTGRRILSKLLHNATGDRTADRRSPDGRTRHTGVAFAVHLYEHPLRECTVRLVAAPVDRGLPPAAA